MRSGSIAVVFAVVVLAAGATGVDAEPPPPGMAPAPPSPRAADARSETSICLLLESAAKANELPIDFFARVIWQESRFKPNATGPMTRRGSRAQGIAQFMPYTAEERGLLDPFEPIQALPKAAEFLSELRGQFGNLGLAAAAYNAGPRRVREWLAGTGGMPSETRNYVLAITGRSVEEWAKAKEKEHDVASQSNGCDRTIALLKSAPNDYVAALERRVQQAGVRVWIVELAASFSRDRALSSYAQVTKRYAEIIGERDPIIEGSVLRSRGTRPFYRVSFGSDTRAEASQMCARIQQAHGACIVLRSRERRVSSAG